MGLYSQVEFGRPSEPEFKTTTEPLGIAANALAFNNRSSGFAQKGSAKVEIKPTRKDLVGLDGREAEIVLNDLDCAWVLALFLLHVTFLCHLEWAISRSGISVSHICLSIKSQAILNLEAFTFQTHHVTLPCRTGTLIHLNALVPGLNQDLLQNRDPDDPAVENLDVKMNHDCLDLSQPFHPDQLDLTVKDWFFVQMRPHHDQKKNILDKMTFTGGIWRHKRHLLWTSTNHRQPQCRQDAKPTHMPVMSRPHRSTPLTRTDASELILIDYILPVNNVRIKRSNDGSFEIDKPPNYYLYLRWVNERESSRHELARCTAFVSCSNINIQ